MLYYIQVVVLRMGYQGGLRDFNQQDIQEWTNHEGATNYLVNGRGRSHSFVLDLFICLAI